MFLQTEKAKLERKKEMSSSSSSNTPNWSELPKELLQVIAKHLDSRIDVFRFRAVSTLWRSLVPLSHLQSQPITLTLPPPLNATAFLSHFTICRLEHHISASPCLVKVVESSSGKLRITNPLISPDDNNKKNVEFHVFLKSHNEIDDAIPKRSVNVLDFRLGELTKGCSLEFKGNRVDFAVKKVVLFGCEGIVVLFNSGELRCWRFGAEDWVYSGKEGARYDDVVTYKDQFYVIDDLGIMFWIDKSTMNLVQYAPPLCGFGGLKHLVVSQGEFYVVDSYLEEDELAGQDHGFDQINNRRRIRRVDMKVYRLDEEWGTWIHVKSLGNRVFVLGKEVSYSVDVRDFPGCPGDCIYFVDPRMEDRNVTDELKRLVVRVFRLDNGTIRTMDCFPVYKKLFSPSMSWTVTA